MENTRGTNQSKGKSCIIFYHYKAKLHSSYATSDNEEEWSKLNIVFITKFGKLEKIVLMTLGIFNLMEKLL